MPTPYPYFYFSCCSEITISLFLAHFYSLRIPPAPKSCRWSCPEVSWCAAHGFAQLAWCVPCPLPALVQGLAPAPAHSPNPFQLLVAPRPSTEPSIYVGLLKFLNLCKWRAVYQWNCFCQPWMGRAGEYWQFSNHHSFYVGFLPI